MEPTSQGLSGTVVFTVEKNLHVNEPMQIQTHVVKGQLYLRNNNLGNTCTPMADSSQCMAKPIQCCKVK